MLCQGFWFPIYRRDIHQNLLFQFDSDDMLTVGTRHGSRPRLARALPLLRLLLLRSIPVALVALLARDDVRSFRRALIGPL